MNLVTGATGLLGTHVMLELLSRGEKVRGLLRPTSSKDEVKKVFAFYKSSGLEDKIEWIEGDVLDVMSLEDAMKDCTHVYHCAAVVSYHSSDRPMMYKVNVEGTANVVNACKEYGVEKLCHVSSIAALGRETGDVWLRESSLWVDSDLHTHYGITKHLSEMEVWRGDQEGLKSVIVNPGFIIGPGTDARSSTSAFRKIKEGLPAYPKGGTGFIAVTDVARSMVDLCKSTIKAERFVLVAENLSMKEFFTSVSQNLGVKTPAREASESLLQAARLIEAVKQFFTGKKALVTKESIKNTSLRFYYDTTKIKEATHIQFRSIEESIKEVVTYLKQK